MLKGRHIKTLIAFFTALYLLGYSLASAYPVENSRQHRDDHSSEIVFISEGQVCWEGDKNEILNSDCKTLNDFVFANALAKKIKSAAG